MNYPKLDKKADKTKGSQPGQGLSSNETTAADANLSASSPAVQTSDVKAGAGAGSTGTTPGSGSTSRVPETAAGPLAIGVTLADDSVLTGANPESGLSDNPTHEEIAARAYHCWYERGCPDGSPEIDWTRAEQELRTERRGKSAAAAAF